MSKRRFITVIFGTIFLTLVTGTLYTTNKFFDFLQTIKLNKIELVGALNFQNEQIIYDTIAKVGTNNFYSLNLSAIKRALLNCPWVEDVALSRRWPSTLRVKITEREPFAILANEGIVSTKGELFRPLDQTVVATLGLPVLFGPKQFISEIIQQYLKVAEYIFNLGLHIKEFELMPDQGWRVLLDHNVNLYLGSYELEDRLKKFALAYKYKLNNDVTKIAYVDLRYTNGIAVRLK